SLTLEGLSGNRYVWYAISLLIILQLAFTYLSPMQTLFHTVSLEPQLWLRIILVASSVLWLVELEKMFLRWRVGRTNLPVNE
nr:cation transporting ATPase C-terminal domain-containing protein [Gammaproteobacteria bacterium]